MKLMGRSKTSKVLHSVLTALIYSFIFSNCFYHPGWDSSSSQSTVHTFIPTEGQTGTANLPIGMHLRDVREPDNLEETLVYSVYLR